MNKFKRFLAISFAMAGLFVAYLPTADAHYTGYPHRHHHAYYRTYSYPHHHRHHPHYYYNNSYGERRHWHHHRHEGWNY